MGPAHKARDDGSFETPTSPANAGVQIEPAAVDALARPQGAPTQTARDETGPRRSPGRSGVWLDPVPPLLAREGAHLTSHGETIAGRSRPLKRPGKPRRNDDRCLL